MMRTIPRILIAGVQSGSGKTTLTIGLISALRRRGLRVQAFKAGPDFLDPTWLSAASGRPCYNLDGWMSGRDYVEGLLDRVTKDADLAVIEGVMGLFDGSRTSGSAGSSAEIARWLQAPVVLVGNVHGMGQSIAALVAGFAGFEEGVRIRGVIANHCGSENHRTMLNEALASSRQPLLVGAIPRMAFPQLHSRHLGLVTADPARNCSTTVLKEFATAAERYLDLDEIIRIAREAPPFRSTASHTAHGPASSKHSIRLAVARDEAFNFYYQDLFDELERRGCRIGFFSPLHDSSLPAEVDALYLGGGYPEEFAGMLAANTEMLSSIVSFAHSGRPVYAECGGLIYLSQAVTTRDGKRHPLLGILPAETRMLERRKRLGYVEVCLKEETLWGKAGTRLRGHEFHYSELTSDVTAGDGWSAVYEVEKPQVIRKATEGFSHGRVLASYIHLHLASKPAALAHFLDVCVRTQPEKAHPPSQKEISP